MRINRFFFAWTLTAIVVVFGARGWNLYDDGQAVYLQILMRSSVDGTAVVYYDLGDGLSEKDSAKELVGKGDDFKTYRFLLPDAKIHYLRLDPLTSEGHVKIRSIRVTDGFGNSREDIAFNRIKPIHQIVNYERTDLQVSLDMEAGANDPQLLITFPTPVRYEGFHSAFFHRLGFELLSVVMAFFLLLCWAAWEDRRHIRKWIGRTVIAGTLAMVLFFCVQTCLAILQGSIRPAVWGDTEVFLFLAAQKWTSPAFYHGGRPWTVPVLHSLVNGVENKTNLILLQTVISYASWIFLAFSASRLLKDELLRALTFVAVACIPLILFIDHCNFVIESESYSFSFLALFLGMFFWYFRSGSWASVIALAFVALLFAFVRDTDAYRVLFMAVPVLLTAGWLLLKKIPGALRHAALFVCFLAIFIASDLSTSNIHNPTLEIPYTNARWYMPMINNLFQRVLPFEDRMKYFQDQGLPVTPEVMAMTYKWADTNNWQSARDPELAALREWNYLHGRQTYGKYLLTHPAYTLKSAYPYRGVMFFFNNVRNVWYHAMAKPVNLRFISPLFLNTEKDVRMFLVLFPLIGVGIYWIGRRREDDERQMHPIRLISYIILIAVPHAILIFHGDLMDLPRHQFTNIIQLNIGVVLFYLLAIDWWLCSMRRFMKHDSVRVILLPM